MVKVPGKGSPGHVESGGGAYSAYGHEGKGLTDEGERAYAATLASGSDAHRDYTTYMHNGVRKARGTFQAMGHTAGSLGYGSYGGGVVQYSSAIGPGVSKTGAVLFDAPVGGGSAFTGVYGSIADYESIFGLSDASSVAGSSCSDGSSGGQVSKYIETVVSPSGTYAGDDYGAGGSSSKLYAGAALVVGALYFLGRRKR